MKSLRILAGIGGLTLLAAASAGCEEEGIRVQRLPRTAPANVAAVDADVAPDDPAGSMTWAVPGGWNEVPGQQDMRLATLQAGSGDAVLEVAVSAFPGDAGGVLPNINRWRRQLSLPPIAADEVDQHSEVVEQDGVHVRTLRITGPSSGQPPEQTPGMLAAIIEGDESRTWFVRATGPAALLDRHEAAFVAFARSFRLAGGSSDHEHVHAPAAARAGEPELIWAPPESWQRVESGSPFVYASFIAGPAERPVVVRVTPMPGDGGDFAANLQMWRQQLGLPAASGSDEQGVRTVEIAGEPARLVELDSDSANGEPARSLIVAVVPRSGRTWFLRMVGPTSTIDEERDDFIRFVQAVRFPEE